MNNQRLRPSLILCIVVCLLFFNTPKAHSKKITSIRPQTSIDVLLSRMEASSRPKKHPVSHGVKKKPTEESSITPRFHLAFDIMGNFSSPSQNAALSSTGDMGLHTGLNLKIDGVELTFFGGIDLSLNIPWNYAYAKTGMIGLEVTGEISDPVRWALQASLSWAWYNRLDQLGHVWNPDTQIPLQMGLEITLIEGKRSELSFQVLGGIAPSWSAGIWSLAGVASGALHANL